MAQVSLDEAAVARVTSEEGTVAKADFIKLSQDLKLLDFGGPMGQEKRKLATPRRERRVGETDEEGNVNINFSCILKVNDMHTNLVSAASTRAWAGCAAARTRGCRARRRRGTACWWPSPPGTRTGTASSAGRSSRGSAPTPPWARSRRSASSSTATRWSVE